MHTSEGEPILDSSPPRPRAVPRLLRHRLTSPEKRTIKRIQGQRLEMLGGQAVGGARALRAQILQMLREDRGLQQGLEDASSYEQLADWLVDESLAGRTAAEIIGVFLRETGAMERPELSAPRVKSALRTLNEVLYAEQQTGIIAQGLRELRLEKRDGGLQIVGILRGGADEGIVRQACLQVLRAAGHEDIDVRLVSRH